METQNNSFFIPGALYRPTKWPPDRPFSVYHWSSVKKTGADRNHRQVEEDEAFLYIGTEQIVYEHREQTLDWHLFLDKNSRVVCFDGITNKRGKQCFIQIQPRPKGEAVVS